MPKRIVIEPHLTLEELEARYRRAKDSVERSHYQIIWLLAQGRPSEEVASITGYSRSWIYELVWGYNRVGPETLGDKRHDLPGAEPLLNETQLALLSEALQSPPPEGGRWNGTKVANWMSQQLDRPINRQRGWEYLKSIRAKLQGTGKAEETGHAAKIAAKENTRRATNGRLRRVNSLQEVTQDS
jgi:transposase